MIRTQKKVQFTLFFQDKMADVKRRSIEFIRTCEELLQSSNVKVREEVIESRNDKVLLLLRMVQLFVCCLQSFITICDLLIVFSRHLSTTAPKLDLLIFEPDRNLQGALSNFLGEAVFVVEAEGGLCACIVHVHVHL